MDQRQPMTGRRFNGNCNYCNKPGHKWSVCRKRLMESETKSNEHRRARFDSNRSQQNGQNNYRQTDSQSYQKPRPMQQRPQTTFTIEAEVDEEEPVEANTVFCESFSCDPLRNSS